MFMKRQDSLGRVLLLLVALSLAGATQTVAQDDFDVGDWRLERTLGLGSADHVAISPDGDTLAVAGSRGVWLYSLPLLGFKGNPAPDLWVNRVYWSPDSQLLATISHGGFFFYAARPPEGEEGCFWRLNLDGRNPRSVRLWHTVSGGMLHRLKDSAATDALAWSPSGHALVGTGDVNEGREADGSLRLWDAATGIARSRLTGAQGRSETVAWSPDGNSVASVDQCGSLSLWNIDSGIRRASTALNLYGSMLSWSPDSSLVALADTSGRFFVVDAGNGSILYEEKANETGRALAWSPDGSRIALAGDRRIMVFFWNGGDMDYVIELVHTSAAGAIAWSPDSRYIASADESGLVKILDAWNGPLKHTLEYDSKVLDLAWMTDCCFLVARTHAGDVVVRDALDGSMAGSTGGFAPPFDPFGSGNHELSWWPDSQRLFAGEGFALFSPGDLSDPDGELWHMEKVEAERVLAGIPSPDGKLRACFCEYSLVIIDNQTEEAAFALETESRPYQISWSRDGTRIAVITSERSPGRRSSRVRVWQLRDAPQTIATFSASMEYRQAVDWSPDGRFIAISGEIELPNGKFTSTIRIHHAQGGKLLTEYRAAAAVVSSLEWSPDGRYLASGSNHSLALWYINIEEGVATELWQTDMRPYGIGVSDVAWSPDGQFIASGHESLTNSFSSTHAGQVMLLDAGSGRPFLGLTGHTGSVRRVAWSPDGTRLASTGDDAFVQIWRPGGNG